MARRSDSRPEFHGQKRPADDDLEGEQPLTKKLGSLHIGPIPRLYGDGISTTNPATTTTPSTQNERRSSWTADSMLLDDTKDTIYIHDLEKEIADIEAEEQNVAFLPEIDKRLTTIPKSVLRGDKPANNELVLYRLPTSLTVPEDRDSVRKAVAEARDRAGEAETRELNKPRTNSNADIEELPTKPLDNTIGAMADNGDAMDIDGDS